jgi:DNA-binding CsgD family transcriptional regulator
LKILLKPINIVTIIAILFLAFASLVFDISGQIDAIQNNIFGESSHLHDGDDGLWHLPFELVDIIIITLVFIAAHFYYQSVIMKQEFKLLDSQLQKSYADVSSVINKQLNHWGLTKTEQSISWGLINGNNSQSIAESRSVSIKTVNNQISAIFKKANVRNKSEFLSLFLEDISS